MAKGPLHELVLTDEQGVLLDSNTARIWEID